jgi:hypothetical protein
MRIPPTAASAPKPARVGLRLLGAAVHRYSASVSASVAAAGDRWPAGPHLRSVADDGNPGGVGVLARRACSRHRRAVCREEILPVSRPGQALCLFFTSLCTGGGGCRTRTRLRSPLPLLLSLLLTAKGGRSRRRLRPAAGTALLGAARARRRPRAPSTARPRARAPRAGAAPSGGLLRPHRRDGDGGRQRSRRPRRELARSVGAAAHGVGGRARRRARLKAQVAALLAVEAMKAGPTRPAPGAGARAGGSLSELGRHDGGPVAGAGEPPLLRSSATALCLNGGRFRVEARWHASQRRQAPRAVPLTADTVTSGSSALPTSGGGEVLNGVNDRHWVFAAGLTNVEVDLIADTWITTSAAITTRSYADSAQDTGASAARRRPRRDNAASASGPAPPTSGASWWGKAHACPRL